MSRRPVPGLVAAARIRLGRPVAGRFAYSVDPHTTDELFALHAEGAVRIGVEFAASVNQTTVVDHERAIERARLPGLLAKRANATGAFQEFRQRTRVCQAVRLVQQSPAPSASGQSAGLLAAVEPSFLPAAVLPAGHQLGCAMIGDAIGVLRRALPTAVRAHRLEAGATGALRELQHISVRRHAGKTRKNRQRKCLKYPGNQHFCSPDLHFALRPGLQQGG